MRCGFKQLKRLLSEVLRRRGLGLGMQAKHHWTERQNISPALRGDRRGDFKCAAV